MTTTLLACGTSTETEGSTGGEGRLRRRRRGSRRRRRRRREPAADPDSFTLGPAVSHAHTDPFGVCGAASADTHAHAHAFAVVRLSGGAHLRFDCGLPRSGAGAHRRGLHRQGASPGCAPVRRLLAARRRGADAPRARGPARAAARRGLAREPRRLLGARRGHASLRGRGLLPARRPRGRHPQVRRRSARAPRDLGRDGPLRAFEEQREPVGPVDVDGARDEAERSTASASGPPRPGRRPVARASGTGCSRARARTIRPRRPSEPQRSLPRS